MTPALFASSSVYVGQNVLSELGRNVLEERVFRTAHCTGVISFLFVEGVATLIESIDL